MPSKQQKRQRALKLKLREDVAANRAAEEALQAATTPEAASEPGEFGSLSERRPHLAPSAGW